MRSATDRLVVVCAALTVLDASNKADGAKIAAAQIQAERTRSTLTNCREQNARHDKTIGRLDDLIARTQPLAPDRRPRVNPGRNATVFLIDGLVPHRNCARLVARTVNTR
jgi:hypothetical protein